MAPTHEAPGSGRCYSRLMNGSEYERQWRAANCHASDIAAGRVACNVGAEPRACSLLPHCVISVSPDESSARVCSETMHMSLRRTLSTFVTLSPALYNCGALFRPTPGHGHHLAATPTGIYRARIGRTLDVCSHGAAVALPNERGRWHVCVMNLYVMSGITSHDDVQSRAGPRG